MKPWRVPVVLLAVLAVTGLLLGHASLPHSHASHDGPALFNQEHDLTTLAGPPGGWPASAQDVPGTLVAVGDVRTAPPPGPVSLPPAPLPDPRAPPRA